MSMQLSNKPFYVLERQKFAKLTKHLPIQGGCWIFRIQAEDFTRGGYKFRGGGGCVKTPRRSFVYIFPVNYSSISGG